MPDGLTEKQRKYVKDALFAGSMPKNDIILVVTIAKLLGKEDPLEVQSVYMDAQIGLQQVFRDMVRESVQP